MMMSAAVCIPPPLRVAPLQCAGARGRMEEEGRRRRVRKGRCVVALRGLFAQQRQRAYQDGGSIAYLLARRADALAAGWVGTLSKTIQAFGMPEWLEEQVDEEVRMLRRPQLSSTSPQLLQMMEAARAATRIFAPGTTVILDANGHVNGHAVNDEAAPLAAPSFPSGGLFPYTHSVDCDDLDECDAWLRTGDFCVALADASGAGFEDAVSWGLRLLDNSEVTANQFFLLPDTVSMAAGQRCKRQIGCHADARSAARSRLRKRTWTRTLRGVQIHGTWESVSRPYPNLWMRLLRNARRHHWAWFEERLFTWARVANIPRAAGEFSLTAAELAVAAELGDLQRLRMLTRQCPRKQAPMLWSVLLEFGVLSGSLDVVKYLASRGANSAEHDLVLAVKGDHDHIAEWLLHRPNQCSSRVQLVAAFNLACRNGAIRTLRFLHRALEAVDLATTSTTTKHDAEGKGQGKGRSKAGKAGKRQRAQGRLDSRSTAAAASHGVARLDDSRRGSENVENGQARDNDNETDYSDLLTKGMEKREQEVGVLAMNLACQFGHVDILEFLHKERSEGCSLWAPNWAAEFGHVHVLRFLLEHRPADARLATGWAMRKAIAGSHLDVVQLLLDANLVALSVEMVKQQLLSPAERPFDSNPAAAAGRLSSDMFAFLARRLSEKQWNDFLVSVPSQREREFLVQCRM